MKSLPLAALAALASTAMLAATAATAQSAAPAAPAAPRPAPPVSQKPGPGSAGAMPTISSEGAEKLGLACEAWAVSRKLAPAIWILDVYGDPVYMSRQSATSRLAVETARKKADTVLAILASTTAGPNARPTPAGLDLLMLPGGLPILSGGVMVGAIGVGGMPGMAGAVANDEACAKAALDAVFK